MVVKFDKANKDILKQAIEIVSGTYDKLKSNPNYSGHVDMDIETFHILNALCRDAKILLYDVDEVVQ